MIFSKSGAALAAVVVLSLTLAGCSNGEPDRNAILQIAADQAQASGSAENAKAMRDGELTEDEYYEAARRYQACFQDIGIAIEGPTLSPVDEATLLFAYEDTGPADEEMGRAIEACSGQWTPVVAAYGATHEPKMDEGLRRAVIDCMNAAGYAMTGNEKSVIDFVGDPDSDGGTQRSALERCVTNEAIALFPDLPSVMISY